MFVTRSSEMQVLLLSDNKIRRLPESVCNLTRLQCLHLHRYVKNTLFFLWSANCQSFSSVMKPQCSWNGVGTLFGQWTNLTAMIILKMIFKLMFRRFQSFFWVVQDLCSDLSMRMATIDIKSNQNVKRKQTDSLDCDARRDRHDADCRLGWVDIGIRTTVRLGKVHFVAKGCKICLKMLLVHWPLPDRCTLLGPCSTYGSKIIFSQYRVYGYQKTQNFT
jgi:hypothetical protein